MARSEDKQIRCSFCGRTQDQVERLVAGRGAYICSDCVRLCARARPGLGLGLG